MRRKRYNDYGSWLKGKFPFRVQKIPVDAGFSCPNRDGSKGSGGCVFCENRAFVPSFCDKRKSISEQIADGKAFFGRKYPDMRYIAYFQAYTNTYADLDTLRRRYDEALSVSDVVGLIIATRPDCVDDHLLDYLASLAKHHYLMLEYGIESCYDRTLQFIQRHHDYACTVSAIRATAERGIPCGGHLILGLPGESREEIVVEASLLSHLPLTTLKLHQLQLLRGSKLGADFLDNPASVPPPFTLGEYISLLCDFLEHLRPNIIVERYAAAVPPSHLADPSRSWHHPDGRPVKSSDLARLVTTELNRRNTYQGIRYIR